MALNNRFVSLFCLALLLAVVPSLLAGDLGTISGEVIAERGGNDLPPIMEVTLSGFNYTQTVYTHNGRFEFNFVPAGVYSVTVTAQGFAPSMVSGVQYSSGVAQGRVWVPLGPPLPSQDRLPAKGGATVQVATLQIPPKAKEEFSKAMDNYKKHKTEEAVKHLEKAIKIYPHYYEAYNNLGVFLWASDHPEAAEQAFVKAAELGKDKAGAQANLGLYYVGVNKPQNAVDPLTRAIRLDPTSAKAEALLGEAHFRLRQDNRAEKHLRQALMLDPDSHRARYILGRLAAHQGKYSEALLQFRRLQAAHQESEFPDLPVLVAKLNELVGNAELTK